MDRAGERRVVLGQALYADEPTGPAVGDWVALRGEFAVAVLPRTGAFVRTGAGRASTAQVVAANLDLVLVVDGLTADPRLRRVERYLAVAWGIGATMVPIVGLLGDTIGLAQALLCISVVPLLAAALAARLPERSTQTVHVTTPPDATL